MYDIAEKYNTTYGIVRAYIRDHHKLNGHYFQRIKDMTADRETLLQQYIAYENPRPAPKRVVELLSGIEYNSGREASRAVRVREFTISHYIRKRRPYEGKYYAYKTDLDIHDNDYWIKMYDENKEKKWD